MSAIPQEDGRRLPTNKHEFPLVDFTVDGYVDVDEDLLMSEMQVMADAEISVWVTQSQYDTSDVTEDNNGDKEEDIDWEMWKDEICQAFDVLWSCCLFQDDGEKMWKKVSEIEKIYEMSLTKMKQ